MFDRIYLTSKFLDNRTIKPHDCEDEVRVSLTLIYLYYDFHEYKHVMGRAHVDWEKKVSLSMKELLNDTNNWRVKTSKI